MKVWIEDEWLTDLYSDMVDAKNAVRRFAEGRPFDNERELRVTRYYGRNRDAFNKGKELAKGDPDIQRHEWMRYAEFIVHGRSDWYEYAD